MEKYEKILVEQVYQNSDTCSSVICRLPKLYGDGDPQHHLMSALRRIWDERPYIVLPETLADWKWSRCYTGNISRMITSIIRSDTFEPAVYNLGPEKTLSEKNWLSRIADVTNWSGEIRTVAPDIIPDRSNPFHWEYNLELDTSRFWQRFPETQILPLEAALERSILWEKGHATGQFDSYYLDYNIESEIIKRQES
jgi:nucleoside-diphosphate-sugar epimerase